MLNIALFGPPGAGKGTQSKLIIEKYNFVYISTGDMLREQINNNTKFGKEAKKHIDKGHLVPDELVARMIKAVIEGYKNINGFLFDGFPRTFVQAYILDGLLLKRQCTVKLLISLEVPREELINRLLERGKISGRTDDNLEIIEARLKEYRTKTAPVLEYYDEQSKLYTINGVGEIDEIFNKIKVPINLALSKVLVNIVLFGPPGAGKGTQAKILAQKYNLIHIATGDMLRKEIKHQTHFGKIAEKYLNVGDLVPDEIVIRIIENKIRRSPNARGFLFDGFPITLVQAYILNGLLRKMKTSVTRIITIDVPPLESVKRLLLRGEKSDEKQVYDKKAEVIIHRLEEFDKKAKLVEEHYAKLGLHTKIKGVGTIQKVTKLISKEIEIAFSNAR